MTNERYTQKKAVDALLRGEIIPDDWMAELAKVKALSLTGNQITDPSGLAALTGLETLSLTGNQITDPSGLIKALPNTRIIK